MDNFIVVLESVHLTKVLFAGTLEECKLFRIDYGVNCDDIFIQELAEAY